jgi:hypothetical protein
MLVTDIKIWRPQRELSFIISSYGYCCKARVQQFNVAVVINRIRNIICGRAHGITEIRMTRTEDYNQMRCSIGIAVLYDVRIYQVLSTSQ